MKLRVKGKGNGRGLLAKQKGEKVKHRRRSNKVKIHYRRPGVTVTYRLSLSQSLDRRAGEVMNETKKRNQKRGNK